MKCAICEEARGLQFAHIVPVKLLKRFVNTKVWVSKNTKNGIMLCPNHHWYYDHGKLSKKELELLFKLVEAVLAEVIQGYSKIEYVGKGLNPQKVQEEIAQERIKFYKWLKKTYKEVLEFKLEITELESIQENELGKTLNLLGLYKKYGNDKARISS